MIRERNRTYVSCEQRVSVRALWGVLTPSWRRHRSSRRRVPAAHSMQHPLTAQAKLHGVGRQGYQSSAGPAPPATATASRLARQSDLAAERKSMPPATSPARNGSPSVSLPPIRRSITPRGKDNRSSTARKVGNQTDRAHTQKWRTSSQLFKAKMAEARTESRAGLRHRALAARRELSEARTLRDWPRCELALTDALEVQPDDLQLLSQRATVFLRQRKIDESLSDAQQLVAVHPESPRGYSRAGVSLTYRNQYSEAAESLAQALELDPTDTGSATCFEDVLGSIRRQRSYWQLPHPKANPTFDKRLPPAKEAVVNATRPGKPAPLKARVTAWNAIRVSWQVVEDDGGDECFQYEVQFSAVDPMTKEAASWKTAFSGIRKFGVTLSELLPETEYVFRLQATNSIGGSLWSDYARARTEAVPAGQRRAVNDIPQSWHDLQHSVGDAFTRISPAGGLTPQNVWWDDTLSALRRHMAVLKQCFRIYTLVGTTDDNPIDVSISQFRRMVSDLKLTGTSFPAAEIETLFMRSTRRYENAQATGHRGNRTHGAEDGQVVGQAGKEASPAKTDTMSSPSCSSVSSEGRALDALSSAVSTREPSPERVAVSFGQAGHSSPPLGASPLGAPMRVDGAGFAADAATHGGERGAASASSMERGLEVQVAGTARDQLPNQGLEVSVVSSPDDEARLTTQSKSDNHLGQNRFVAALIRLAAFRARALSTDAAKAHSLGQALDELVTKHVLPFADLTMGDQLSEKLKERNVRWVLEKWREEMAYPYAVFSTIDDEGSLLLMNLKELLQLLRESGILDESLCSEHKVKTFFAMVNMDDELFEACGGHHTSDNSSELTLDEFLEIVARICFAKIGGDARKLTDRERPFENTLDDWITHVFHPPIMAAARVKVDSEKAAGGGKRAKIMRKLKALQRAMEVGVQEDEDEMVSDPNARADSAIKMTRVDNPPPQSTARRGSTVGQPMA